MIFVTITACVIIKKQKKTTPCGHFLFAPKKHLPQAVLQGILPDRYRNHLKNHSASLDTKVWFKPTLPTSLCQASSSATSLR